MIERGCLSTGKSPYNLQTCFANRVLENKVLLCGGLHTRRTSYKNLPRMRKHLNNSTFNVQNAGTSGVATFSGGQGGVKFHNSSSSSGLMAVIKSSLANWKNESERLTERIKNLGLAGVAAYGIFNTLYYCIMFCIAWFFAASAPTGMGLRPAIRKFLEVMGLVWAGSQVTKLARLGGAIMMAPIVDRGLEFTMEKLNLESKRKAFLFLVLLCLSIAFALFGVVIGIAA